MPSTRENKTEPKTVLVVEDDADLTEALATALESGGYRALVARGPAEALELVRGAEPDLIVSDVHLANGDGRELLAALRREDGLAARPFVLMTGDPVGASQRASMDLGADDYLEKPFTPSAFLDCVQARLGRAAALQESQRRMARQLRVSVTRSLPHELLTPLNGILGFAEILRQDALERDEVREIGGTIYECGDRLLRAIRNYLSILELMETPAGATQVEESVAAPELSREVEGVVRALAGDRDRAGDFSFVGALAASDSFQVEPECVKVVARELVDNALRFSSPGSPVAARLSCEDGHLVLSVVDSGRGLSEERIRSIASFREFDRSRYAQQGLGLGLTLAQQLLDKQGGALSIESAPGAGATVSARWPV